MSHEIPDDLRGQVELTRVLGVNLYLQDKASASGTDAMLAHVSPTERRALGGYLTIREEAEGSPANAWLVFFSQPTTFPGSRSGLVCPCCRGPGGAPFSACHGREHG
jgi:hypothetical protein